MLDFRLIKFSLDKGDCSFNKETEEFNVELGFQIKYSFNDAFVEKEIPKKTYTFKSDYKSGHYYIAIKPVSLSTYSNEIYLDDSYFLLGYIEFRYNEKYDYLSCSLRPTLVTYPDLGLYTLKQGDFTEGTNTIYGPAVRLQSNFTRFYKEGFFNLEKPYIFDFSTVIQSGTFIFEPLSGRIVDLVYYKPSGNTLLAEKGFYFPEGVFSKSGKSKLDLTLPETDKKNIVVQDLYFGYNYTWPKNLEDYSENLDLDFGECPYTISHNISPTLVNAISILIPLSKESEGIFPFFFTKSWRTNKSYLGYLKLKGSKVVESGIIADGNKILTKPQDIELTPVFTIKNWPRQIETLYLLNLFNYIDKDYAVHFYLDNFYLGSIDKSQNLEGSEGLLGILLPLIGLPDLNYSKSLLPKGEKPLILRNFIFLLGFKGQSPAFYFKEPEKYSKYFEDISHIFNITTYSTRLFYTYKSKEKFLALHQSERCYKFAYRVGIDRLVFTTYYSEKDTRTLVLKFKALYTTATSSDGKYYEIFYDSNTGNFVLNEVDKKGNDSLIQDGKEYLLKVSDSGNLYAEEIGATDKSDSHPKIKDKEDDSKVYELWIDENGNLVAREVE